MFFSLYYGYLMISLNILTIMENVNVTNICKLQCLVIIQKLYFKYFETKNT